MLIVRTTVQALVVLIFGMLAAPRAADGEQPGRVFRVGCLETASHSARRELWDAFRQGLREFGYVEGQHYTLECRWGEGKAERLPELAADLARAKVDVIVTSGTPAGLAAKQATGTIPIVLASVTDPVGVRLVAGLARPGGNVTGVTTSNTALAGKSLEALRDLIPDLARAAVLADQTNPGTALVAKEAQTLARPLGVTVHEVSVRGPEDFDRVFRSMGKDRVRGLVVATSPMFYEHRRRLADLALKHRLPAAFLRREYAEAGGLLSYGASLPGQFRLAARYVDKILKGAKPADLPIEQPMRFELVINLRTAKALGLTVPRSIITLADEVIQ